MHPRQRRPLKDAPGMTADEVLAGLDLRRAFTHGERPRGGWTDAQWGKVLDVLTPVERQVAYLWLAVGLTVIQIGEELGCTKQWAQALTERITRKAAAVIPRGTEAES